MATITSASSGNFSAPATWVGGVVPGAGDDAVAATGHVVAIDVDTTVISVQQAGTGKFTLGNGRTLTGNVIANAGTFTSGGTVDVTATTTAVINGNVTGVSTTANNTAGIVVSGTGSLTVNGSVTGSPGTGASEALGSAGVYTNVTCTITINGAVTAGTGNHKSGVRAGSSSNSAITIIGDVIGILSASYCVWHAGTSGTITITANTVSTANNTGYSVYHTGASGIITINATTVQGGANTNAIGVVHTGISGAIVITATTVQSGSNSASHAISHSGTSGTINITATTIQAGAGANAVQSSGSLATVTATATTIQGNVLGVNGIEATGVSSTVNAVGHVKGLGTLSHGVRCNATANGVIFQGDMTDSTAGAVAIYTRIFRMSATNSGVTQYANTVGYPTGTLVSRVSPDNVTGMAQIADVRLNTIYGYNNELTGTVAIPPAQSVAYGVPVDATTGTAEFDLARVAEIIGLQVAAGATEGTSL